MKKIIIIGCGGHGKVIIDIILKRKLVLKEELEIIGILDDKFTKENSVSILGVPVIGKIADINKFSRDIFYVIGIGNNNIREEIAKKYFDINYITLIHPNSVIGEDVKIGFGTVIMANAVINSGTTIGNHCILNTRSIVEHDNKLEDYVHISPGATLCGGVTIGQNTWIGAGSTIIQNILIGKNSIVGAGSTVIKNIDNFLIVMGNPAKEKRGS